MNKYFGLLLDLIITLLELLKPGGVRSVMAENLALKQQSLVLNRGKKRSQKLSTSDRFLFGVLHFFVKENRIQKITVILKPATILKFHKALVQRKYSKLIKANASQGERDLARKSSISLLR